LDFIKEEVKNLIKHLSNDKGLKKSQMNVLDNKHDSSNTNSIDKLIENRNLTIKYSDLGEELMLRGLINTVMKLEHKQL
jgi:hypothetical protein